MASLKSLFLTADATMNNVLPRVLLLGGVHKAVNVWYLVLRAQGQMYNTTYLVSWICMRIFLILTIWFFFFWICSYQRSWRKKQGKNAALQDYGKEEDEDIHCSGTLIAVTTLGPQSQKDHRNEWAVWILPSIDMLHKWMSSLLFLVIYYKVRYFGK